MTRGCCSTETSGRFVVSELSRRAWTGLIRFQAILALLLFLPAWSLRFWEAWVYWIVFSASLLLMTRYFLKHAPRLVERRLEVGPGAEKEKRQRIIQVIASLLLLVMYVIPGLDHRFH